ncbi:hypothetical protein ACOXXX_17285 [Thalassococcus sp. BH17M4-6]|uniref:hypothetical protein n=1 Tax=Thalassococcus sp. BH17M4-6 TaxID=3413148 RepID=UPI003BE79B55
MSLIKPEDRLEVLEREREHIAATLKTMKAQLFLLNDRLAQDDLSDPAGTGKLLQDLRYWLKAVRETEAELENVARERAGITSGYGLDLASARTEIGCRLARLKACCRTG